MQLDKWAMPVVTLVLAGITFAIGWGIQQRDREELSRRLDRLEAGRTSERLAIIETKLDLVVSGLGLSPPAGVPQRVQR